jgi:hypothetical protein
LQSVDDADYAGSYVAAGYREDDLDPDPEVMDIELESHSLGERVTVILNELSEAATRSDLVVVKSLVDRWEYLPLHPAMSSLHQRSSIMPQDEVLWCLFNLARECTSNRIFLESSKSLRLCPLVPLNNHL